jgi:hypothetical protein
MFVLTVDVDFGTDHVPEPLIETFTEVVEAVRPLAAERDPETLAEAVWCGCHGLATLSHSKRLRPAFQEQRIALLADSFAGTPTAT